MAADQTAEALAAIQADPAHQAAVRANAGRGIDAVAPGQTSRDPLAAAKAERWAWTDDDVYYVGTTIKPGGYVTVVLRRGSRVQHIDVRLDADAIGAEAVRLANGRIQP